MPFCFVTEKDHFKQRLLLWSQVPIKEGWVPVNIQIFRTHIILDNMIGLFTCQM